MNKNEDKKEVYTQIEKDVLLLHESMNILHNVVQTQQTNYISYIAGGLFTLFIYIYILL